MELEVNLIKSNLDTVDLFKLIASIFVVGIHLLTHPTLPYQTNIYSLIIFQIIGRFAVPFFFIVSAYLFYSKYFRNPSVDQVKKFCKRIMKLYSFWFIILLPITINQHIKNGPGSIRLNLLLLVKNFFIGETFGASWYLMSSLFSIVLITYLLKYFKIKRIILMMIPIFVGCVITSTYGELFLSSNSLYYMKTYLVQPATSIFCGLFYISVGAYLAQIQERISKIPVSILWGILGLTSFGSIIEVLSALKLSWVYTTDQYFLLPVSAVIIFLLSIRIKTDLGTTAYHLRNCSTTIYLSHLGISFVLKFFYQKIMHVELNNVIDFIITILIAILLYMCFYRMKKIFKYAY